MLAKQFQPGDLVSIDMRAFSVRMDIFKDGIQLGVCLHKKRFVIDNIHPADYDLGWAVYVQGQSMWFPTNCLNRI